MNWKQVALPERMARLEKDPRGLPIPFLVLRDKAGGAHFTINDERKRMRCIVEDRCAICGERLFRGRWYVGGPLAAFHEHGAFADTPLHRECCEYALQVCPYLAAPKYSGRVDDAKLDWEHVEEGIGLLVDQTMLPDRPPCFVALMALGHEVVGGMQMYLKPKRPYRHVEYWRGGARITAAEGEAIVKTALAGLDVSKIEPGVRVIRRPA